MWFDEQTIYQIYPLGACGAPFQNDFVQTPRIRQIEKWCDHLKKLGVDTVLFNPLFQSVSHGYDTIDYRTCDSRLGTNEDLAHVCRKLQERGFRILFDAVFNHVGRDFGPFQDVLKNRENSRYKDWFTIDYSGNNSYNDGLWYKNWEGYDALVALNLKNPEVVKFLLDTVDFWKETFGISGLRLDVAYCLDHDFLKHLHDHVKAWGDDFFLLGETLHGDYNTWVNREMLDSCTNYECYKGLYSSFNSRNFFEVLYSFNRQFGKESWCLYTGKHLLSFVDNHDVTRIASQLEKKEWLPLIYTILFTMPGIPAIYYGSEWGIEGMKNENDTSLRPAISELEWNGLTDHIARLIKIRKEHPSLMYGDYSQVALTNTACLYSRCNGKETVWTAINIADDPQTLHFNAHGEAVDLLGGKSVTLDGSLTLGPNSAMVLKIS